MRKAYSRFMQARGHRQRLALLGSLLYTLFAIALPSLHLGFHRADHEHRDGGLQLLHTGLGVHHTLALPHSHGPNFYNEDADDREGQAAGAFASPDSQISLCAAALQHAPGIFAYKETRPHVAQPGSGLLGTEGRAPQGSPAPDPMHGSGSLVHFASALVTAHSSVGLPFAGLLFEQARYIPRAECAPRSPILFAKHARGPPAPVATI